MILLFFYSISVSNSLFAQSFSRHMTKRGDTAEIYLSCEWYADPNYITWNGIFHSTDNGHIITLKRLP